MHVVVLGAGYAGLTCALRLARLAGERAHVSLINADAAFVQRIRLHEQLAHGRAPNTDLAALVAETGVELRLGRVTELDLTQRTLTLRGRQGAESLSWDRLVLATGSHVTSDLPGVREHAYRLDAQSTQALAEVVPALSMRRGRVLILGGGLTGIEAACELAERWRGLQIQLVTRSKLAGDWSVAAREHVLARFAGLGVRLLEDVDVRRIEAGFVETSQGRLPFDACLWSGGFVASPLARDSGLAVNELGQVWVDAELRACSHPAVYAIGDAAVPRVPVGDPLPMGCKSAIPMGMHAAENLARELCAESLRPLAFVSPFFCVSLGRNDGLVQRRSQDRSLRGGVLVGRPGAWLKELVCRGTLWFLRLEGLRARWSRTLRRGGSPRRLTAPVASRG
jgi:NADH dehydrogenase FAD-containing subunit